jgi:hypothetical protein
MPGIEWRFGDDETIAATGDYDVTIDREVNVLNFTLAKVSGGNVTALTVARSLDGANFGPARTVTLDAALSSAGDAVDVDLVDEMPMKVRFGVTLSASTVVRVVGRGCLR